MLLRTTLFLSLSVALPGMTFAQASKTSPAQTQAPLIVGLETPLDTNNNKLQVDSPVFASTLLEWKDGNCHLKYGSVVAGHVVALDRHSKQGASVRLLFDHADCDHINTPIHFMLAAVMAAPPVTLGRAVIDPNNVSVLSAAPMSGGLGSPIMSLGAAQYGLDKLMETASRDEKERKKHAHSSLQIGDVQGLKNVTMQVDQDKGTGSELTSAKDHLHLEQSTRFLLVVKEPAAAPPATKPLTTASATLPGNAPAAPKTVTAAKVPPPPPPPEIDETSICTDSCSVATEENALPARATATLPTQSLGFLSHDRHLSPVFGFEASLFYLDANNILFTYDPHHLRTRSPNGFVSEPVRSVRAVLLDANTLKVKRVVDWKVQGEGQYIWHVGANKILVHLGRGLRLLGPDLAVLKEIPLPTALAFVSVSPSGNYILTGLVNERHTREMHDEMVASMKEVPVEDVNIQIYDGNFAPVLQAASTTVSPVPVLSDSGEVLLAPSSKKDHFLVTEMRWDHTRHTVADLISSCTPSLSTPQEGMVFVTGCRTSVQHWYRMVRLDGHAVLTGSNTNPHFEECFSNSGTNFAVRSIRTHVVTATSANAKPDRVTEQEISIYRSTDGKRLFSVVDPGVSFAHQSFSVSPNGNQLAVLSGTAISLYPVTATKP